MIGTRLGNWVIDQELGRGGMGRVYRAHEEKPDGQPGRKAAVKVLAAELAQDIGFLTRFQREIEILSRLDHPNIVHFFEAGQQENTYYYAMEHVAGPTFSDILEEQKRLPWKETLAVALQITAALRHAHNHGIIHRDLKPANLMRTEEGVVKLADFGIAKVFATKQLTATGALVGTAEYLSPEQAAGKNVTVRSDLYSLGVVLYAFLTGRCPFEGKTILDLLHKHRFAQFDAPRSYVPDLPHELDEVVCNLLAKEPEERPANATVLQKRLESIQQKLQRKEEKTFANVHLDATVMENVVLEGEHGPGPGTLMSQMMREELRREKEGNWFSQQLNRPWVLVTLFSLCVSLIVWIIWYRPSLATSEQAAASDGAGRRKDFVTLDRVLETLPVAQPSSKAQEQYWKGLQLCREGKPEAAQAAWQKLVQAESPNEDEKHWVNLARHGLKKLEEKGYGNKETDKGDGKGD